MLFTSNSRPSKKEGLEKGGRRGRKCEKGELGRNVPRGLASVPALSRLFWSASTRTSWESWRRTRSSQGTSSCPTWERDLVQLFVLMIQILSQSSFVKKKMRLSFLLRPWVQSTQHLLHQINILLLRLACLQFLALGFKIKRNKKRQR